MCTEYDSDGKMMQNTDEVPVEVDQSPKRRNKGKKALIIVLSILLITGVLGFCFKDTLIIWLVKLAPDSMQLKYAYAISAKNTAETLETEFDAIRDNFNENSALEGTVSFDINSSVLKLAKYVIDVGDLERLDNTTIDYEFVKHEDKLGIYLTSNKNVVKRAEVVMDFEEKILSVLLPDLGEEALFCSLDIEETKYLTRLMEFAEVLIPEKGLVIKLLPKYAEIVFDELKGVKKDSKNLTVSEISQKTQAFSARVDEEVMLNIIIELLETARRDKRVFGYAKEVYNGYESLMEIVPGYEQSSWDATKTELANKMDAMIEKYKSIDAKDVFGDTEFIITTWVNSKFEILAIEVESVDKETCFFAGKSQMGENVGYALELKVLGTEYLNISGSGEEDNEKFTGLVTVSFDGKEYFHLNCEDFSIKNGDLIGQVNISSSDSIYDGLIDKKLDFLDLDIDMEMTISRDEFNFELGADVSGVDLATFTIDTKDAEPDKVELPEKGIYDVDEWKESLDLLGGKEF